MNAVSRIVSSALAAGVAVVTRRLLETGWQTVKGDDPPIAENLTSDADLRDLFVWSGLLLASVVLARKLAASLTRQLLG